MASAGAGGATGRPALSVSPPSGAERAQRRESRRGVVEPAGGPVAVPAPADAIGHGIGMVHQHFML
ncbi:MAG: hypothetical protein OXE53_11030, partial [Deltaproteobacteria bacterium]|nr:hypothetical protein [Deltaproteobacteria bacterium]